MKKSLYRVLSLVLMLCMLASLAAPFGVFAETATAEKSTPSYIFRDTFSSGTVNTSSSVANVKAANGFYASTGGKGGWYNCEDDALVFGSDSPTFEGDEHVNFSYFGSYGSRDLTEDFTLSLWLKPHSDTFSTSFAWGENALSTDDFLKINKNRLAIAGTIYSDAKVPKDEWSLIEIVYHYDETATATNGKTGATTSYSFMLNGKTVAANVPATAGKIYNNIDQFRFLRYPNAGYSIDDLTLSYGTSSFINNLRTGEIFFEDFSKGYVTTSTANTAISEANGFKVCTENGSSFDLSEGTLKFTEIYSRDYVDILFTIDAGTAKTGVKYASTRKNLKGNFTLSAWVKPLTDTSTFSFNWAGQKATSEEIFKVLNNKFVINGTTYGNAALVKDEWALIEIVFYYDATATAVTGETGATTKYAFMLNGKKIATVDAKNKFHNIDSFRLFRWNGDNEFELDDLSIAAGVDSRIDIPRSSAPVKTTKELWREDFSDSEYNYGFAVNNANGSSYTVADGIFKWNKKMSYDSVGLDLSSLDLAKDFILSFKLRTAHETAMRFEWKDSDAAYTGDYEFSSFLEGNRLVAKDDWKATGRYYPDAVIGMNEWALLEFVFHYDENAVSVTGEKGAITFYTVLLNGERITTVKTMTNFHEIDDFRLFHYFSDEFEIDDLTVTAANYTAAPEGYNGGWDKKQYFFTSTGKPVTDYDYSFAVVGDPQCLAAWAPNSLDKMYTWIANNVEAKKMKLVMGVGDIVNDDTDAEWARSVAATSKLNGKVPYTLVRGNHDGSAKFKEYFYDNNAAYVSQFTGESGGLYNGSDNFWKKIEVGGDKWLIIGLDVVPDDDELDWACGIIEANPDYKVIVTTHEYLKQDGGFLSGDETDSASFYSGKDRNDGDVIWEKLGRKYANISMIISGHIGSDYVVTSTMTGDHGNNVTQMLIDFQVLDDVMSGNGGIGVVTMFYFKEGEITVSVEAYSTAQEAYFLRENQFKFNLDGSEVVELPNVILKEDFSTGSINTSANVADFVAAGGFRACVNDDKTAPSLYTLDYNTLKYTFRTPKDYIDIHFYHAGLERDLAQDFVLSFWIKPDVDNLSMNDWTWSQVASNGSYYKVDGVNARETKTTFRISGGYFYIGDKKCDNAKLNKDEWALVEIVYNYDENATSVSGEKGAITSYTFLLNGEVVGSTPSHYYYHNINYWRIMQYAYGTYAIDDLIIATGSDSLINTLSKAPTERCVHEYDNACDAYCNLCGEERAVEGHTYDNDFDADCNNCGEIRPVEIITSGEVSRKIFWAFEDGVLTVTGRGKIKNFSAGITPWSHLADKITKVVIGEGITYIGSSAFYCCANIESVELPESLTAMGNYVFYGCSALKSIEIPAAVTEIGKYSFRRSGLETIDFAIGYGWSAGDREFSIADIISGGHRFISKSYYKQTWVRNTEAAVETLDPNYVAGGIMHTDVIWELTDIGNGNLKLTIRGNGAMADFGTAGAPWYAYWEQITEIEIQEGVTTVGRCAFYGLKFVRKVTVPTTVTSIGDYGFYMCRLMKEITLPEGITIGKDAFVKTGVTV